MNLKTAGRLLPAFLSSDPSASKDSRIGKAVRAAAADPDLAEKLAVQKAFDMRVAETIAGIKLPADLAAKVEALEGASHSEFWKSLAKNPAVLAAILSIAVVATLVIRGVIERAGNFPGKEIAQRMVNAAEHMSGVEFEPIKPTPLAQLNDWFAMNGMDRFDVPPEFAGLKAVGCRVYKQSGFPVAQALVQEHDTFVYVFRGADLGIKLEPSSRWHTFAEDDWTGAIRAVNDLCFLVAFRGTDAEMKAFLNGLEK